MTQILLKEIEQCRAKMIAVSANHAFTSNTVIKISKELDKLLNQLQENMSSQKGNIEY
ncbi:aspartyl-phosphate phosphatase Spo0E family protein [Cerasibacillus terrae]|uniref:Aspartyl-phosphate phosphatase Spo0E family protein n=1 Tax=Cerasibacillus terrae TaxID=2498845 RepID=A0A5C8NS28_9BACI|nr:aspartyl-phosphate phosphatase Spo0E family protein [Cerasibacillus terrae]TXL63635.1 aspartyl-phosphate phosphatase Spo0E family protein [Cerasibacillus terrae]